MTWGQLLEQWALIEADLHELYGIDVGDQQLMRVRSWRWLRVRILALLDVTPAIGPEGRYVAGSRLARHFQPDPREER